MRRPVRCVRSKIQRLFLLFRLVPPGAPGRCGRARQSKRAKGMRRLFSSSLEPPSPYPHEQFGNESSRQRPGCAPKRGLEVSRSIRCQGLETFQQHRDGHNDSPDYKRPRPGQAYKQRDSEIANEVVELPTEFGAWSLFGWAESGDHKQDHNRPAANFCTGTKPRFHGAHRNTPTSKDSTVRQKLA